MQPVSVRVTSAVDAPSSKAQLQFPLDGDVDRAAFLYAWGQAKAMAGDNKDQQQAMKSFFATATSFRATCYDIKLNSVWLKLSLSFILHC